MAMRMKEQSENKSMFLDSKLMNSRNITESAPLSGFLLCILNKKSQ